MPQGEVARLRADSLRTRHCEATRPGVRTGPQLPLRFQAKADVVLSLDADFLGSEPGNLRSIADFMARRRMPTASAESAQASMNRLYCVETDVTCTGAKADHRLAVRAQDIESVARAIARLSSACSPCAAGLEPVRTKGGSRRSRKTCRRTAAARWSWPASVSRSPCISWLWRSTSTWEVSARRCSCTDPVDRRAGSPRRLATGTG